jgi:hypothetical protein
MGWDPFFGTDETYLVPHDIETGLDIGGDLDGPLALGVVHQLLRRPLAGLIVELLANLEELELVDVHIGNVALIRSHPCRDGTLVAVQPPRPPEGDVAARASLGNQTRSGAVDALAGDILAVDIIDGTRLATTVGNAVRGRLEEGIDIDVVSRVAEELREG